MVLLVVCVDKKTDGLTIFIEPKRLTQIDDVASSFHPTCQADFPGILQGCHSGPGCSDFLNNGSVNLTKDSLFTEFEVA